MYPPRLGVVAQDPVLSCQGLPLTDPCWIAIGNGTVDTSGNPVNDVGSGGGGTLPAPTFDPIMPDGPFGSNVGTYLPGQMPPIQLRVTGAPGEGDVGGSGTSTGLPWYIWAMIGLVGYRSLRKSRGGGSWE